MPVAFDEWVLCAELGSGWEVLDHQRHPTALSDRVNKTRGI